MSHVAAEGLRLDKSALEGALRAVHVDLGSCDVSGYMHDIDAMSWCIYKVLYFPF